MYHIFFIHSSVNECLGCFRGLVVVNNAAMNFEVHVFFELQFSLDVYLGIGSLKHMVTLFLLFKGNFILFSIVACIYIPTNSIGGSLFLHTLSRIYYL